MQDPSNVAAQVPFLHSSFFCFISFLSFLFFLFFFFFFFYFLFCVFFLLMFVLFCLFVCLGDRSAALWSACSLQRRYFPLATLLSQTTTKKRTFFFFFFRFSFSFFFFFFLHNTLLGLVDVCGWVCLCFYWRGRLSPSFSFFHHVDV